MRHYIIAMSVLLAGCGGASSTEAFPPTAPNEGNQDPGSDNLPPSSTSAPPIDDDGGLSHICVPALRTEFPLVVCPSQIPGCVLCLGEFPTDCYNVCLPGKSFPHQTTPGGGSSGSSSGSAPTGSSSGSSSGSVPSGGSSGGSSSSGSHGGVIPPTSSSSGSSGGGSGSSSGIVPSGGSSSGSSSGGSSSGVQQEPDAGTDAPSTPAPDAGNDNDAGNDTDAGDAGTDAPTTAPDSGTDAGSGSCVNGMGYWKEHPAKWMVSSLTLGSTTYTESQCLTLLNTPANGDASIILAYQLTAALLNNGANDPHISAVVAAAQTWMTVNGNMLPYGIASSTVAGGEAVNIAALLDGWNEGRLGTPSCK